MLLNITSVVRLVGDIIAGDSENEISVACRSGLCSGSKKGYGPNDNPTPQAAAIIFSFFEDLFLCRNKSAEGEGRSEGV